MNLARLVISNQREGHEQKWGSRVLLSGSEDSSPLVRIMEEGGQLELLDFNLEQL